MFFRPSDILTGTFMSLYYCTFSCWSILANRLMFLGTIVSVYYSTIPCWPVWLNRPMFIGTVIPVYHTTFCHWSHRRMFILAQHTILLVSARHGVSGKSSQKIFKPCLPHPFLLPQPQSSTSLQISPDLLKPSHPQGISCSLHLKCSLLFSSVCTPNQCCALQCEPFRVFSS